MNFQVDFQDIKLLSKQYVWKYNAEINTHTYFEVPIGTCCKVKYMSWSSMGIPFYVAVTPDGDKLKLGRTTFEPVKDDA